MFAQVLFLRSPTREKFLRWLAGEFPRLVEAYERSYAGRAYLNGPYKDRVLALVDSLKRKHGFAAGGEDGGDRWRRPEQIALF
jgi:hypothetical protein